jgi:hypothetical protein
MQQAIGKFHKSQKSRTGLIFIPSDLTIDSTFPLKSPCNVLITISGSILTIRPTEEAR